MQQRKFAVFDIDGTVIRWQLYHAIVDELGKRGHISPEVHEQIRMARMTWKKRGHKESFKEYEHKLIATYHTVLAEINVADVETVTDFVFEEYKDQVYTYTRDLIRHLKSENYLLFAISGSQQEIIDKLAAYYGFDEAVGTTYAQKEGHLIGVESMVIGRKGAVLQSLVSKYGATYEGSIAAGDSAGDIDLLESVEQPIAFNPAADLLEVAKARHWKVVIERKNVIYELEYQDGQYLLAQTD